MKLQLVKSADFCGNQCDIYSNESDMFMTISQLATCLEYANRKGIEKMIERNPYLKTDEFSVTIKMSATDGKLYDMRVFNEDGIYEVTMLAKTEKAKQFRAFIRKLLKSLRKGESSIVNTAELEQMKIKAQYERATAMRMNAENRRLKLLLSNPNWKNLSDVALQTMGIKAVETVTGQDLSPLLPQCEKLYSATEVAKILGIMTNDGKKPSSNKIGTMSNKLKLKETDENNNSQYGVWVMDKSASSSKEMSNFKYNSRGVQALAEAFGVKDYNIS